jgi:hypothetical protein
LSKSPTNRPELVPDTSVVRAFPTQVTRFPITPLLQHYRKDSPLAHSSSGCQFMQKS